MNKINELINKLCPNGVEYKKLKNISEMKRGTYITKKNITEGEIPVISGGREPAYYCDTYNRNGETITVAGSGAGAGFVQYWEKPIFVCDAFSVKGIEGVKTKYLYYCLANIQESIFKTKKGSGVPHVHISSIENFKVPVPPMEVQNEIVRILDDLTLLSEELSEKLSAELKARQKQYEYYKDKIWEKSRNYKSEKMSNLCEIGDGLHGTPVYSEGTSLWFINGNNLDCGKITISSKTKEVSQESYNKYFIDIKKGSVLLSINGTIGKTAYYNNEKVILGKSVAYFNINETNRLTKEYLFFYLQSQDAINYYECSKTGSTIKNLGLKALREMKIPLPSIEQQKEIVNVLSRFDKLCNDISNVLPAEIEAREKQYEYYRDKLLTFKELKVEN